MPLALHDEAELDDLDYMLSEQLDGHVGVKLTEGRNTCARLLRSDISTLGARAAYCVRLAQR